MLKYRPGLLFLFFQNRFQGVFPVKCNQDRWVVESVVEFGKEFRFGLEVGSKAELLLAIAKLKKGSPESLLICNGYKVCDTLLYSRTVDVSPEILKAIDSFPSTFFAKK